MGDTTYEVVDGKVVSSSTVLTAYLDYHWRDYYADYRDCYDDPVEVREAVYDVAQRPTYIHVTTENACLSGAEWPLEYSYLVEDGVLLESTETRTTETLVDVVVTEYDACGMPTKVAGLDGGVIDRYDNEYGDGCDLLRVFDLRTDCNVVNEYENLRITESRCGETGYAFGVVYAYTGCEDTAP